MTTARLRGHLDRNGRDDLGLLSRIGNTPLLRLARIEKDVPGLALHGKAEWFNPGGSVKDRAAWAMVEEGIRSGAFREEMSLLDATSGNTGIAYAWIGSILGFRVTLALPS